MRHVCTSGIVPSYTSCGLAQTLSSGCRRKTIASRYHSHLRQEKCDATALKLDSLTTPGSICLPRYPVQLTQPTTHCKTGYVRSAALWLDIALAMQMMGLQGPLNLRATKRTYFCYYWTPSPIIFKLARSVLQSFQKQKCNHVLYAFGEALHHTNHLRSNSLLANPN